MFVSMKEPKSVKDALEDIDWNKSMEEEIKQIEKNITWTLVLRPEDKNVIDTKWVSRNKLDENGGHKEQGKISLQRLCTRR